MALRLGVKKGCSDLAALEPNHEIGVVEQVTYSVLRSEESLYFWT
jgi:hypothetical protein